MGFHSSGLELVALVEISPRAHLPNENISSSEIPRVQEEPHEEAETEEELPRLRATPPRRLSRFSHSSADPINIVSCGMSSFTVASPSLHPGVRTANRVRRPNIPIDVSYCIEFWIDA